MIVLSRLWLSYQSACQGIVVRWACDPGLAKEICGEMILWDSGKYLLADENKLREEIVPFLLLYIILSHFIPGTRVPIL